MLPDEVCQSDNESQSNSLFNVSRWLMILGGLIMLITLLALQRTNSWDVEGYIVLSLLHGLVYLFAVWKVKQVRSRPGDYTWILIWALAFRALAMLSEPALTTDAFRYVWDGKLQMEGVNPYQYVPADPQLESLRDENIYPHINKKEVAHTIYPPAAQVFFLIGASFGIGLEGMKIVGLICECITIGALLGWLKAKHLPATLVLIYAWHPLPIWEFSSQAHVDCAATALMVLAILAAQKRYQGWAGVALSAAVLVKYFPIVIFPAIWKRWDWRMPVAMIAFAVLLCLPYWMTLDASSLGFLYQHLSAEGYAEGWGFHPIWFSRLLGLGTISGEVYLMGAIAVLGVLGLRAFFQRERAEIQPKMILALGALYAFLSTPHYPWYFGFLVALSVIHLSVPVLVMTVLCCVLQVTRSDDGFFLDRALRAHVFGATDHLDLHVAQGLKSIPSKSEPLTSPPI